MPQKQSVQRTELRLRVKYPHLQTRIFENGPLEHVIVVPQEQLDATQHRHEFEHAIKQVTDFVVLSNVVPDGADEIAPLADTEIAASLSGLPFTVADLIMIVAGKFPTAPLIVNAIPSEPNVLDIMFEQQLPSENESDIRAFLAQLFEGYSLILGVEKVPAQNRRAPSTNKDKLHVLPIRARPHVPPFIADDEQWWFDNLRGIFDGTVPPSSFELTRDAGYSCYIQGTAFPNVDLRQALLAYDTIFLEPPFADDKLEHGFWESQSISPQDLLRLIDAGRLRLIHSQPEERSDLGFLSEAYQTNPAAVFSRRKLAALVIADIVETADEYVLGRSKLQDPLRTTLATAASELNVPLEELARSVWYPSYLRRAALVPFLNLGAMGLLGINQGSHFAEAYQRIRGKEVSLEADMFGQSVHIAHVLNATYIPHGSSEDYVDSWLAPMQLFGDRLNFYRSFNTRIGASWAVNERIKQEQRAVILPPVPVVQFDKRASIDHILSYTSFPSDRRKARSLIARLANLPEAERTAEIGRMQQELYDYGLARDRRERSFQWLDVGSGITAYAAGLNLPPIFAGAFLLQRILETARRLPQMDKLIDAIEEAISPSARPNEDLHLLSKISRVASLRD